MPQLEPQVIITMDECSKPLHAGDPRGAVQHAVSPCPRGRSVVVHVVDSYKLKSGRSVMHRKMGNRAAHDVCVCVFVCFMTTRLFVRDVSPCPRSYSAFASYVCLVVYV
jgi:hypothetical protein